MLKRIESLNEQFSEDKSLRVQDFLTFKGMEKKAVMDVKRKIGLSKSRAIAIACKLLLEKLEGEDKEDKGKKDEKE